MKIIFLPPADQELKKAVIYYNDQLHGLGDQFYNEVITTIEFIQKFPQGWQKVGKHTRKCVLQHFSYLILYVIEEDKIIITAIAHQHRHPDHYLRKNNN